jgi:hypothetical protein
MVEGEPKLFENWDSYMKLRQVMVSAVIFKTHGWFRWQMGHAKLFGILLWDYETKSMRKFKYSNTLKKQGYNRTHNYRLLKGIVDNNLLQKDGRGHYSFTVPEMMMIKNVVSVMRELDMIGSQEILSRVRQKSENTVL